MLDYQENEVKILDINVLQVCSNLDKLGAPKVFDDDRVFTTFDTKNGKYRKSKTKNICKYFYPSFTYTLARKLIK